MTVDDYSKFKHPRFATKKLKNINPLMDQLIIQVRFDPPNDRIPIGKRKKQTTSNLITMEYRSCLTTNPKTHTYIKKACW